MSKTVLKNNSVKLAVKVLSTALLTLAFTVEGFAKRPVPSTVLLERLEKGPEIIGIVHWGLNTYGNKEWGYGDANPAILNPTKFDANQIIGAAKAGGLGGLVIVAKHHDGFCLWPTKTTDYNITKSPFRGGKGDYVREMADACRKAGLKFGVYVSPWDRHDADYAKPKYVEKFHEQIRELLGGGYGEVFEMWFDGANGGDGYYGGAREKRRFESPDKYYRYGEVFKMVRRLQPGVTIFAGENDASDFRWPGNEKGILDNNSRATVCTVGGFANRKYGNPNYRKQINKGSVDGEFFRACEADFPLRRGWFWHAKGDGMTKSSAYLTKLYLSSVGNGGIMNIGISPDNRGLMSDEDVKSLKGFSVMREALFRQEAQKGDLFNVVVMSESIAQGEQVDKWEFIADGKVLLKGTAIGRKRIRLLDSPCRANGCELKILKSGGKAKDVRFKLYHADEKLVKTIKEATTTSGETDTAMWMTGKTKESK